ncbi:nucleotidyltransferase domain-containing protein [Micromonospora endolithica]|uniref:Nucleotidyltransferase domain-containing protein n=1 Tax=Micromonospora endolithica TaxID=230091 RepID=A0A3A9Z7A1_9ACTN|nr:nucleotidyltransferase domain-containing protein [Micromonospora endolithica]RKN44372.1 nucleotidyltransferase domain-containing protein [Micromonospora endolithica]TWJ25859.1 nucleotidyltransferase-like protein [Micromonospora endolithica]
MIPDDLAERLCAVDGVVAVALGGSRARGEHRPDSDWDLGLYYRGPLDVPTLRALATAVGDDPDVALAEPGGWGPWVDGGGWLRIGGVAVDWIYRDLDRVHRIWADCRAGRYEVGVQPGHPLGFYSHTYAGEVALSRVLADPTGELTALRAETSSYPPELAAALAGGAWEVDLLLAGAAKAAPAGDSGYVAGCLFRAVGVLVQVLHAKAGRWLLNEKGAVASAGRLPGAPPEFAGRAQALLGAVGRTPDELAVTLAAARRLADDVLG